MLKVSALRSLSFSLVLWTGASPLAALADSFEHEIVGGSTVTDFASFEYKHTVRLLVGAVTDGASLPEKLRGIRLSWRCSAAILGKSVLVSAAHCFPASMGLKDPDSNQVYRASLKDLKVEAFFKTDPRSDRMSGNIAQRVIVHEGFREDWTTRVGDIWNPSESIHDVALIKLRDEIPADKAPVGLLSAQDGPLSAGETLVMAGYGRDLSDEQISLPRLRSVSVPLRENLRNGTEWFAGSGDTTRAGKVERPGGGCMGDSGGPVYAKRGNSVRLVGVIVRGPDEANGGCAAAVTISTSLPAYATWLGARMREMNSN
ncbi:MAG: trypsin-like serine protease [Silvanigrellaceae bacterium]